jgi:uncharacterized protein YaaR (DUF327 family)
MASRFKVGQLMKARKEARQEKLMKNRRIEEMEEEIKSVESRIKEKGKILKTKTDRLLYLDSKVCKFYKLKVDVSFSCILAFFKSLIECLFLFP